VVTISETTRDIGLTTKNNDRVAVLLMGYGEVESYDDFANYNEQALNLLTAKFAPVPNWIYPPLAKLLALFDFLSGVINTIILFLPTTKFLKGKGKE